MAEHLLLTFPETRATEPVIYRIVTDYDVVPNIRRAAIENHLGWMVVELDGAPDSIRKAKEYLVAQGIGVERAEGDIVEG
ncbi:MAG: NIL domain-containing protein [Candidatus Nanopelagicales bacterium]